MRPLLVATTSRHKLEEYRALLAGLPFDLRSLADAGIDEDVEETGTTFEDNARLKAERYRDLSGLLTLADDSGIEVDALDGQPGVHSKRWAGDVTDDDRNARLLELLADVPDERRTARYRCVIAVAEPGRETRFAAGSSEGLIAREPAGANGFGYDPLFFVPELNQTFGQVDPEVKNRLSHRGRAAQAARRLLEAWPGDNGKAPSMVELSEIECLQRLRAATCARLLALDEEQDEVYIVPVNFVCVERAIYFYTEPGRKLSVLQRHPEGAGLQTDGATWSVLATGRYRPGSLAERALCTAALLAKYQAQAVAPMWGKARGQWRPFLQELSKAQVGVIPVRTISGLAWE